MSFMSLPASCALSLAMVQGPSGSSNLSLARLLHPSDCPKLPSVAGAGLCFMTLHFEKGPGSRRRAGCGASPLETEQGSCVLPRFPARLLQMLAIDMKAPSGSRSMTV